MFRKSAWRWAAVAVASALGPAAVTHGSEPPSSKVARWHDEWCPRDLTPIVSGPCYGYYPTRWRVMPPCDPLIDLVLPPLVLPPAATPLTQGGKAGPGKVPAGGPSPYGQPARPAREQLPKGNAKGGWTPRPATDRLVPAGAPAESGRPPRPDEREARLFPPPE